MSCHESNNHVCTAFSKTAIEGWGRAYELVQPLSSTETSWPGANNKNVNFTVLELAALPFSQNSATCMSCPIVAKRVVVTLQRFQKRMCDSEGRSVSWIEQI